MSLPAHNLQLSVEEYLALEQESGVRHEYINGRVFAMTGASQAHNSIVSNLHLILGPAARHAGCRALLADMKVQIKTTNSYYYPDLLITCEAYVPEKLVAESPCLVVEVLSPSTADIDRREKLVAYQSLASVQEYLIVYQNERRIEVYQRKDAGWTAQVLSQNDSTVLEPHQSLYITLKLDDVYAGILDAD